jgi:hypothetical protein
LNDAVIIFFAHSFLVTDFVVFDMQRTKRAVRGHVCKFLRNEPWSTPRANELLPFLDSAIAQLQSVLDQQPGADPTQITQCFTLACSDGSQIHD